MNLRRETLIQRPNGQRVLVITERDDTWVSSPDGEVLRRRPAFHHERWVDAYTRDGGQVVTATGKH